MPNRYIFNKKWEGNFTLSIAASRGSITEDGKPVSRVYLDDITTRWIPRFVEPEVEVEVNGTEVTNNGTTTTQAPGDGGEEESSATAGVTTGFLIVVIVILLLVVLILGFKHWQLKQSVAGAYQVSRTPVNSNYDNPMYSGQHTPGDRYGSVHD